jgi:hypothetical protein
VVCAGETLIEPFGPTVPTPLSISTSLALVLLHVKVALDPAVTLPGDTVSVTVGVFGRGGGAASMPPPQPTMEVRLANEATRTRLQNQKRGALMEITVVIPGMTIGAGEFLASSLEAAALVRGCQGRTVGLPLPFAKPLLWSKGW